MTNFLTPDEKRKRPRAPVYEPPEDNLEALNNFDREPFDFNEEKILNEDDTDFT